MSLFFSGHYLSSHETPLIIQGRSAYLLKPDLNRLRMLLLLITTYYYIWGKNRRLLLV